MPKKGKVFFNGAAEDARHLYSLEKGADIHTCLGSLSRSFEDWRYLYEQNNLSVEIQSIRYTMHTGHEACLRVRDDVKKT